MFVAQADWLVSAAAREFGVDPEQRALLLTDPTTASGMQGSPYSVLLFVVVCACVPLRLPLVVSISSLRSCLL